MLAAGLGTTAVLLAAGAAAVVAGVPPRRPANALASAPCLCPPLCPYLYPLVARRRRLARGVRVLWSPLWWQRVLRVLPRRVRLGAPP